MYNQPCENCLKITWTLVKCNEHNKGSNKLNWENVGVFLGEEGIGSQSMSGGSCAAPAKHLACILIYPRLLQTCCCDVAPAYLEMFSCRRIAPFCSRGLPVYQMVSALGSPEQFSKHFAWRSESDACQAGNGHWKPRCNY